MLLPIVRRVRGNNWHLHCAEFEVIAYAQVDDGIHPVLSQFRWGLMKNGYAKASARDGKTVVLLHKLVWNLAGNRTPEHPETIDHIDRNKLNCKLENLRVANKTLQQLNKGLQRNNKTGFIGVSFCKRTRKYRASGNLGGRMKSLKYFDDPVSAAKAVNDFYSSIYPKLPVPNKV
jgi:hypothetical protein